jgi:glycosyltransferase involved in cell wall biosynthesis
MAMARPIVATSIDGVREQLRHNKTGLLVPPAEPEKLAKAILAIINDQRTAKRLARQARKDAEQKFDLKHTLASVEMIYQQTFNLKSRQ